MAEAHPFLIVDDEEENLEMLKRFFRNQYAPIHVATDGEKGIEVLERERVDLILTDQRMPRVDGTELLRRAKEMQPDAMRLLVTGYGDVETLTAAINEGHVYHVIAKPFDLRLLGMVVQRALEAFRAAARERELFEAFVFASVNAIEQRDPSTAGHSFRVAAMTTGLAMVVDGMRDGPFANVAFARDELEQIKFASLLHDFGKIGVREAILVKARKLPPTRESLLQHRIETALARGEIDDVTHRRYHELVGLLNNPANRASNSEPELRSLIETGLLDDEDVRFLRIEAGSLAADERTAIEDHVKGTIRFLKQIPWPSRLDRVVEIAGAHHERLNGGGYPTGATEICIESQMMAICDIYDALVAADRPYKTAVSHDKAMDILYEVATTGGINKLLLDTFNQRKVYRAMRHHT